MNKEVESICLNGLTNTTKNRGKDSRCPGQDSNPAPPKYSSGALQLHQPARYGGVTPVVLLKHELMKLLVEQSLF
jgi:hypothetical protein